MKNRETLLDVDYLLKGLAWSLLPVNSLSKKKRAIRRYAARLIDLNEYLASFTVATMDDKIGVTKLNEILLNIMPKSCSKKSYVQVFYCEILSFKKSLNMFDHMEISDSIYENVVTPSY